MAAMRRARSSARGAQPLRAGGVRHAALRRPARLPRQAVVYGPARGGARRDRRRGRRGLGRPRGRRRGIRGARLLRPGEGAGCRRSPQGRFLRRQMSSSVLLPRRSPARGTARWRGCPGRCCPTARGRSSPSRTRRGAAALPRRDDDDAGEVHPPRLVVVTGDLADEVAALRIHEVAVEAIAIMAGQPPVVPAVPLLLGERYGPSPRVVVRHVSGSAMRACRNHRPSLVGS